MSDPTSIGATRALYLGGLNSDDISDPWRLHPRTPSIDYHHLYNYSQVLTCSRY